MSVAKFSTSNATDLLKLEEGNDPVDTLFKQSIVKDPFVSLMKASDPPNQWIQVLQALDQPDSRGWPFLSPVKVQLQKCDKCRSEFFSPINCRRHIRVHHRLKILDKDTGKDRELLGSFWNKLSAEEAKEIVSFKNLTLEGVPGATIIKNLASLILRPGFSPLSQACNRIGGDLLDIIQARPSTFPLSAQELFRILDNASEKTFLCGPALSMQKYIFNGEAAKIGLEAKNIIACTSFFLEQQLVKAWIAHKDAEALRCQKLLVEEEEAAQRKQAKLLERKRQKKLWQKARDSKVEEERDHILKKLDSSKAGPSAESSGNFTSSVSEMSVLDEAADKFALSLQISQHPRDAEEGDSEAQAGLGYNYIDPVMSRNIKPQQFQGNSYQNSGNGGNGRWKMPSRSYASSHGFHGIPNNRALRMEVKQNHEMKDVRASTTVNSIVRSWKPKLENNENRKVKVPSDAIHQNSQSKKQEVLIGSIPITIESCNHLQVHDLEGQEIDVALAEYGPLKRNINEKICKDDNMQLPPNVDPCQNSEMSDNCQVHDTPASAPETGNSSTQNCLLAAEPKGSESLFFSSHVAKDFLAQRWKEAISGDHVKLVLFPESKPQRSRETQNWPQEISYYNNKMSTLGSAESRVVDGVAVESMSSVNGTTNFRVKQAAGLKKRYVPKVRAST
ncbi:uncharacterized protein LOC116195319 [Punica granatum]|uniref:Uncharacterized protein LOC116195319 n=1 Tax=Punica granatum TaxID=22663 RepID=A0A218WRX9_PUNGR|nr:uncharacterized protein LOC116195319 [Punica granatum]OWM75607.1 hypothetical protein CDL15_Pgr021772 [Punica granatum]